MNERDRLTPNVARIYDYLLGGTANYEPDRRAAEELLAAVPDAAIAAWENREFLGRAVRFLADECGIRQFVDIGTGLPTRGNIHEVAQRVAPESRVAYVDYDPVVLRHARSLIAHERAVVAIDGDLRHPDRILADPELNHLIDLSRPVAFLLVAVLHFIQDDEDPFGIVDRLKDAMGAGSYLVISHVTADDVGADVTDRVRKLYNRATAPGVPRTRNDIMRLFERFQLVSPGLVNVSLWRPEWIEARPGRAIFYAGVGRKD